MRLRYFVVGRAGQLRKTSPALVEDLWHGRVQAEALGCPTPNELRLVSVLCDNRLLPRRVYLLRVPLTAGCFTSAGYLALRAFADPDCVTPQEAIEHHTEGWPADFVRQLAVILDVPVSHLDVPFSIGGPLLLAAALRVPPERTLRYLR